MSSPFATALTIRCVIACSAQRARHPTRSRGYYATAVPATAAPTLVKEDSPSEDRFLTFRVDRTTPTPLTYPVRAPYHAYRDGVKYGRGYLYLPRSAMSTTTTDDQTLRLCPYYDPGQQALKFQLPNGHDFIEEKPLAELIARAGCQPLLHLAKADDLIDKVPSTELVSMDFDTIVESGYYVRAYLSAQRHGTYRASIRFKGGNQMTQVIARWRHPSNGLPNLRTSIDCFPYIKHEDGLLRMWDVEEACNLVSPYRAVGVPTKQGSRKGDEGVTKKPRERSQLDSFHANVVRRRWPEMYAMIRKLGYWQSAA